MQSLCGVDAKKKGELLYALILSHAGWLTVICILQKFVHILSTECTKLSRKFIQIKSLISIVRKNEVCVSMTYRQLFFKRPIDMEWARENWKKCSSKHQKELWSSNICWNDLKDEKKTDLKKLLHVAGHIVFWVQDSLNRVGWRPLVWMKRSRKNMKMTDVIPEWCWCKEKRELLYSLILSHAGLLTVIHFQKDVNSEYRVH